MHVILTKTKGDSSIPLANGTVDWQAFYKETAIKKVFEECPEVLNKLGMFRCDTTITSIPLTEIAFPTVRTDEHTANTNSAHNNDTDICQTESATNAHTNRATNNNSAGSSQEERNTEI